MDSFYISCVETNLATLHYVTFIEPFDVLSTEAISFDVQQFTNNYGNKVFESKKSDPLVLLDEHFIAAVVEYSKIYQIKI
jgi:hypothetical protein